MVKVEPSPPSPGAESTEMDQTQESRDATETLPFRQVKKSFQVKLHHSMFRRIRMFLALPDPDPLVRVTDPDPAPSVFVSNDFIVQKVYLLRLMPVCVGLIMVSCFFLPVPLITSGV